MSGERPHPTRRTLVLPAVVAIASLVGLQACGGGAPGDEADGASASAGAEARASGGTRSHEEGAGHSHDGEAPHAHDGAGSHAHARADTLVAGVELEPGPDAAWAGTATLLAVGDSVRVLVSVEGTDAGARHAAELVAGSCDDPGSELASLTPVAAGSSGQGTSQTDLPAGRLGDHAHGAVRLLAPDGAPAACAPVHLSGSGHTHG